MPSENILPPEEKKYSLISVEPATAKTSPSMSEQEHLSHEGGSCSTSSSRSVQSSADIVSEVINDATNDAAGNNQDCQSKAYSSMTKEYFNSRLQQEYNEELGDDQEVPFSRMRIGIIVVLGLFVVGFVLYYCFMY